MNWLELFLFNTDWVMADSHIPRLVRMRILWSLEKAMKP